MKTTLDIPGETLRQIKALAAQQGLSMREVVERGLRQYIAGAKPAKPFRLRTITTKGKGLVKPRTWDEIRDLIYEGQGGSTLDSD